MIMLLMINVRSFIESIREDVVTNLINHYIPPQSIEEQWDILGLERQIKQDFALNFEISNWLKEDESLHEETLRQKILDEFIESYRAKEQQIGAKLMRHMEKTIMLQLLDTQWKEHLAAMDHLREGIGLRGYAQQDPKQAYKREAFKMFSEMLESLKYDVTSTLYSVQVKAEDELQVLEEQQRQQALANQQNMDFLHADARGALAESAPEPELKSAPVVRSTPKVGRNAPCPCGSGKKYKQCCGRL